MSKILRITLRIVGAALVAWGVITTLWLRLSNMDMTEMRLFVEFWPLWVAVVTVMACGLVVLLRAAEE